MPGRRGTEKRALTALVNVRTSPALRAALDAEADRRGLTAIALARQILVDALPDIDPAEAHPVPRRERFEMPEIVHEMASAREAAAEATGALVMAARRYRETGQHEAHAEAEAVLKTMRRAAGELLDLGDEIARAWKAHLTAPQEVPR